MYVQQWCCDVFVSFYVGPYAQNLQVLMVNHNTAFQSVVPGESFKLVTVYMFAAAMQPLCHCLRPSPPLDNIRVMVIVWRLRGNIIRTALCWIVWHNVHSPRHAYVSSSYRLNRLGLSHWDPYAVRKGGCLELYYCNMVGWFWWDSSLIFDDHPLLWHCWFGHLACRNRPRNDLLCVEWDVKPCTLTHSLTPPRRLCNHLSLSICLSVCLSVNINDHYAKSFQASSAKPYSTTDYSYGKYLLNFGVDPTQNDRMDFGFPLNRFCITYFRRHSLGDTFVLHHT